MNIILEAGCRLNRSVEGSNESVGGKACRINPPDEPRTH